MSDQENLDELYQQLTSDDDSAAAVALDAIAASKGAKATRLLVDFLRTADLSLLTTRAAMALERRKQNLASHRCGYNCLRKRLDH